MRVDDEMLLLFSFAEDGDDDMMNGKILCNVPRIFENFKTVFTRKLRDSIQRSIQTDDNSVQRFIQNLTKIRDHYSFDNENEIC